MELVLATEGRAIVVFDTDVTQWDEGERTSLDTFRRKYAKDPRVILCESMPSIEYWFLLHYAAINCHFGTSKSVIAELGKFVAQFDKTERFLSNPKWVWDMSVEGRLETAMQRAGAFAHKYRCLDGGEGVNGRNLIRIFEMKDWLEIIDWIESKWDAALGGVMLIIASNVLVYTLMDNQS